MPDLPLVLAGPIIRRVTPRACSLWVALSRPTTVTATLWPGTQTAGGSAGSVASGDVPAGAGSAQTRRFGQRIHVALVTVDLAAPTPPLTPGTVHSYDLGFDGDFGSASLRSVGLLRNEEGNPRIDGVDAAAPKHLALGYVTNQLPSFVTPAPTVGDLRLAQASCRKPAGPGYDALAWLDKEIEKNLHDPSARIQQLFLTGDQIYADDVAATFLVMLNRLAAELLGAEERVPVGGSQVPVTLENFPALRRQKLVTEQAGYTSTDAAIHLLSFGEVAAAYLAAWSPRVWRPLGQTAEVVTGLPSGTNAAVRPHLSDLEGCAAEKGKTLAELHNAEVERQRAAVEVYRDAVPKVGRVLANVATYMIFDDHEVTDDWNLNKRWQNRVYTKDLGRSLVRNAVMAYAVFQAWGNDPGSFATGNNKDLLEETEKSFTGAGPYPAAAGSAGRLDELAGSTGVAAKTATFHYTVPGPRHLVAVLDTRTRRKMWGQGMLPPSLLGDSLESQVPKAPLGDGRELLLVVSPVPVLGPYLIERIAQPLGQVTTDVSNGLKELFSGPSGPCGPQGRPAGAEVFDAESWSADENALEALLKRLAPHGRAVILSGDVHYGCSMVLDYWRKGSPQPSRLVQLTSSPSHNSFHSVVEAALRSSAHLQRYQSGPRPERLGWDDRSSIALPAGASIGPGRRARMRRRPALVPARTWPAGTTIPSDKPPDWRWRLSMMRDERPDADLPAALQQPDLGRDADLAIAAPFDGYAAVATRHGQAALTHFDHLRQMVFTNNVGLVTFETTSTGSIAVTHTLLSKDAPGSTDAAPNTKHVMSLAPTSDPQPELVTRG
jgi:hypothetical protein